MQPLFTLDHWKRLPEGFPAQLIDGCLVCEPAPTFSHQRLVGRIYRLLVEILGEERVALSPADVVLDRRNVLQPDVCALRGQPEPDSHDVGVPLAAFEVLSPSTRRRDRGVKAAKLLAAGVEEVWLVDLTVRAIEVRTSAGSARRRRSEAAVSGAMPGLSIVPDDLFCGL